MPTASEFFPRSPGRYGHHDRKQPQPCSGPPHPRTSQPPPIHRFGLWIWPSSTCPTARRTCRPHSDRPFFMAEATVRGCLDGEVGDRKRQRWTNTNPPLPEVPSSTATLSHRYRPSLLRARNFYLYVYASMPPTVPDQR